MCRLLQLQDTHLHAFVHVHHELELNVEFSFFEIELRNKLFSVGYNSIADVIHRVGNRTNATTGSGKVVIHNYSCGELTVVHVTITSAVPRLECSNYCISWSVGHHQCYINWSPIPILHTNFQENPLTTLGISRHFKII